MGIKFMREITRGLLFTVCVFFCGCVNTEYNAGTHTQDLMFVSTEKEAAMGSAIAKVAEKEFTLSHNPVSIKRINDIGNKIAVVCSRQELRYYFYVIEKDDQGKSDEKNAFSIPGGYVYVYKSLFDNLNDDELAFVLAHEIGHITGRHGIKRLQTTMGYQFLILVCARIPTQDQGLAQGVSLALAQLLSGWSQEDEFNADELAVEYVKKAGYNPIAGISLLEKLYTDNKKSIRAYAYFRTHPYTAPRIAHIRAKLHLPMSVDDYLNN